MSPTTSPMRVAASPSSDMLFTVRWASLTAREATSVERVACSAISAMEVASSSTDPAAVVTLLEATVTRYNGFVETGVDADFGKPTPLYNAIVESIGAAATAVAARPESKFDTEMGVRHPLFGISEGDFLEPDAVDPVGARDVEVS